MCVQSFFVLFYNLFSMYVALISLIVNPKFSLYVALDVETEQFPACSTLPEGSTHKGVYAYCLERKTWFDLM